MHRTTSSEPRRVTTREPTRSADEPERFGEAGTADSGHPLQQLHRTRGNQAVQRLALEGAWSDLDVGRSGDRFEREADRVASRMVREAPAGVSHVVDDAVQRKGSGGVGGTTDRQTGGGTTAGATRGRSLPDSERSYFEPRFGTDFGGVRIHADERAADLADALDARAFTHGRDIYFARGEYRPETTAGRRLLAHELTHVVQQDAAAPAIQREVTDQYSRIDERLSRGILDWAITDEDAREVLTILEGLDDRTLIDTYYRMVADGNWSDLRNQMPDDAEERLPRLTQRIQQLESAQQLTAAGRELVEDILRFFYPDNPPNCVNRELGALAAKLVAEARKCSDRMDLVPRPPKNPSLGWLLQQVGKPLWRRIMREGRIYENCRVTVARNFRSPYEIAQINCRS